MLITTRAIVLSTIVYNDKATIAHLFTEAEGMVAFRVPRPTRQGRSRSSALARLIHPLAELTITTDIKPKQTLQRIEEAEYYRLRLETHSYNPDKRQLAFFLAEVLYRILRSTPKDTILYNYISESLDALETTTRSIANFPITFLMGLLTPLGIYPSTPPKVLPQHGFDLNDGQFVAHPPMHRLSIPPEQAVRMPIFVRITYQNMHRYRYTLRERRQILEYLLEWIKLHYCAIGELHSPTILTLLYH